MADKNRTLILLHHEGKFRRFAFITPRTDGSFYFGAPSSPQNETRIGTIQLPPGKEGTSHVRFSDAKKIKPADEKFSYHPAGSKLSPVIQLKNKFGSLLFRYPVTPVEQIVDYRKLFTIVPMEFSGMPLYEKPAGQYDTLVPMACFAGKPFRAAVFLCRKTIDLKALLIKGATKAVMVVSENKDWRLAVQLYQKADFQTWPRLTTFLPYVEDVDIS